MSYLFDAPPMYFDFNVYSNDLVMQPDIDLTMDLRNVSGSVLVKPVLNDPLARGAFTNVGTSTTPQTVDFDWNSTEVSVSALSPGAKQFIDLALGVRKTSDGATNSRLNIQVIPALKYF